MKPIELKASRANLFRSSDSNVENVVEREQSSGKSEEWNQVSLKGVNLSLQPSLHQKFNQKLNQARFISIRIFCSTPMNFNSSDKLIISLTTFIVFIVPTLELSQRLIKVG
jgi:hypothetical protein